MPFFSLIVIVCEDQLAFLEKTLLSIRSQKSELFELIVIDGRKKREDRLLYLLQDPCVSHLFSAWDVRPFALYNKGISLARGQYIHFLRPGEYFLFDTVLEKVKSELEEHFHPDLLTSGYLIRHFLAPTDHFFTPITQKDLYSRGPPINLQPLWFKRSFLFQCSGFTPSSNAFALDILCRMFLQMQAKVCFYPRILIDYEYRLLFPKQVLFQYLEAFELLLWHFGPRIEIFKWLKNNLLKTITWFFRMVKAALLGKKVFYKGG